VIPVTTSRTRQSGIPDVISGKGLSKVSSINGGSNILRVVDSNRSNTKFANKNNIINGTTHNSHYHTNYSTTQQKQQLNSSLQELNKNEGSLEGALVKENRQYTSLSTIFDQFAEVITLDESGEESENSSSSSSSSSTSGGVDRKTAVLLNLACDFTSTKDQKSKWEAILFNNNLYLQIPAGVLFETSKEAFVNLLEYAEEELKCQNVVICLDKSCVEKSNNLIRMFMYFGFYALSPSHPLAPKNATDSMLFMAYSFE